MFGEDAGGVGCDFVVDDSLVVFVYDVHTEFLRGREQLTRWVWPYYTYDDVVRLEFISRPSGLSRSPLIKVPLKLLTSFMNI
jgi:hypothetical protein